MSVIRTESVLTICIKQEMHRKWIYIGVSVLLNMILVSLIVFFAVSSAGSVPDIRTPKLKLVIDHDGGADDAMAIFMALLYEKHFDGPEVVALTTVYGNVDEGQVFNNSQRILSIADRRDFTSPVRHDSSSRLRTPNGFEAIKANFDTINVNTTGGSKTSLITNIPSDYFFGSDGLGDNESIESFERVQAENDHAVTALIELSKKYKDNLIIVTIGALTNMALAVKLDPNILSRISHLYIGAGTVYGDDSREPEFNAAMDVDSYYIVTKDANTKTTTVIPFSQVKNYLPLSKDWRNTELGSINTKIMQSQNKFEQISLKNSTVWCLLDPAVMAIALDGSLVVEEINYSNHSIELCGAGRGVNTNTYTTFENANVALVDTLRKKPYQEFLMDLFSSELTD